jgi:hypothetical protein
MARDVNPGRPSFIWRRNSWRSRVEVPVDDELGDPGLGRHVIHRGGGVTCPGEGHRGGRQDRLAALLTGQELSGLRKCNHIAGVYG